MSELNPVIPTHATKCVPPLFLLTMIIEPLSFVLGLLGNIPLNNFREHLPT